MNSSACWSSMHTCSTHVEHVHGTAGDAGYAGDGATLSWAGAGRCSAAGASCSSTAAVSVAAPAGWLVWQRCCSWCLLLLASCSSAAAVAAAGEAAPAGWLEIEGRHLKAGSRLTVGAEACRHTVRLATRQARQDSSCPAVLLARCQQQQLTAGQGKVREC